MGRSWRELSSLLSPPFSFDRWAGTIKETLGDGHNTSSRGNGHELATKLAHHGSLSPGGAAGALAGSRAQVGMVDLDRIMAESPRALAADRELAASTRRFPKGWRRSLPSWPMMSGRLESELFGEYLQLKMDLEGLLAKDIDAAIDEVKRRRGIRVVVYRMR